MAGFTYATGGDVISQYTVNSLMKGELFTHKKLNNQSIDHVHKATWSVDPLLLLFIHMFMPQQLSGSDTSGQVGYGQTEHAIAQQEALTGVGQLHEGV